MCICLIFTLKPCVSTASSYQRLVNTTSTSSPRRSALIESHFQGCRFICATISIICLLRVIVNPHRTVNLDILKKFFGGTNRVQIIIRFCIVDHIHLCFPEFEPHFVGILNLREIGKDSIALSSYSLITTQSSIEIRMF